MVEPNEAHSVARSDRGGNGSAELNFACEPKTTCFRSESTRFGGLFQLFSRLVIFIMNSMVGDEKVHKGNANSVVSQKF